MTIRPGRSPLTALACAVAVTTVTTVATPAFGHGDHTHGHATLTLVIEGDVLRGEFNFPLESLLGFDYPPKTPAQQQTLDLLKGRLGELDKFIEPTAEAACTVARSQVAPDLATADRSVDIANIVYAFEFECARVSALQSIVFSAFGNHAGLKQLRVSLSAPAGRKTVTVRPKFPAITF